MQELTNPFKKAGLVLLIIGVVDIGVMIYCIVNQIYYSSSFNIFAVIAGILLIKGSVGTARVVRWFSVFLLIGFFGMFLLFPIYMPLDLLATQIKINPVSMLSSFAFSSIFLGVLVWVYFQLSTPEALDKLKQAGYETGKPMTAIYAGLAIILLLGTMIGLIQNSDAASNAISLAQEKFGLEYKYHVSSFRATGDHGIAVVTAYTDNEIQDMNVTW